MAATDARVIPLKNAAYRVTFPIFDADGDLVSGAASLDSEVSKDGGTFTDCSNEATEIATSSGMYYLDLTASEMNADTVAIIVKTGTAGAKTTPIVLYPQEADDIKVAVTYWVATQVATPDTNGYPKVTIKSGTGTGEVSLSSGLVTLAAASIDSIWDEVVEGSYTARQYIRGLAAVLMFKTAGGGTGTVTIRDAADAKNRVSATCDANNNRTAVTIDLT